MPEDDVVSDLGPTVAARRAPTTGIRRLWFDERVAPSLWFVPSLFVVASLVVSRVVVGIDRARDLDRAPAWLLAADSDAAATFSATIAAAMLSFSAVVFSTTLVAIQLAGGQYSPRVVRVFVRSRLTQCTLGLFLATFVFAVAGMVEERSGDDAYVAAVTIAIVYVLVGATLFMFIAFVFGMSRILRVQYLVARVTKDGRAALADAFDETATLRVAAPAVDEAGPVLTNRGGVGVVQSVDVAGLARTARGAGVRLHVLVEFGEYVGRGTPIARVVSGPAEGLTADDVASSFLLGAERTMTNDPGFVFRQLADIAIRALSPAVNDPTTAVQCIDRITDLLGDVGRCPDPSGWYLDDRGEVRVRFTQPGLARLMRLAYVEIIRYGADSPQVVRRLRAAFDVLDAQVRDDVRPVIAELHSMLDRTSTDALPSSFRDVASRPDGHGLG
jgi:uncharacterized membrane protein